MKKGDLTARLNAAAVPKSAPVSLKQAVRLFDALAAMEDMSFGYPEQGCYARAHLMCRELVDLGVVPQKVWAFKTNKKPFSVHMPDGRVVWNFHVAPLIDVSMPDNTVCSMAMDPVMFDGPVSLIEWRRAMCISAKEMQVTPLGKAPRGYKGDYDTEHSTSHLTDEDAKRETWKYIFDEKRRPPRQHFHSKYRKLVSSRKSPNDKRDTRQP